MSTPLNPFHQLDGHLLALQIVVQRLIGQMALMSGHDVGYVVRLEHGEASKAVMQITINGDPQGANEIRGCAQALIDDIYSVASTTRVGA